MLHNNRNNESQGRAPGKTNTLGSHKPLPDKPNSSSRKDTQQTEPQTGKMSLGSGTQPSRLPRLTGSKTARTQPYQSNMDGKATTTKVKSSLNMAQSTSSKPQRRKPSRVEKSLSEDVPLIMDPAIYATFLADSGGSSEYNFPQPPIKKGGKPFSSLDVAADTVLGIALPEKALPPTPSILPPRLIPELQALAYQPPKKISKTVPSISSFESPSSMVTGSSAPWSTSSPTTTPVSWPSTSPGLYGSISVLADDKIKTPSQSEIERNYLENLPQVGVGVPASVSDSSSKSEPKRPSTPSSKIKRKPVSQTTAPTPPPRTSSARGVRTKTGDKSGSSSIDETISRAGVSSTAPSSVDPQNSPLASRSRGKSVTTRQPSDKKHIESAHHSLQDSISGIPISTSHTNQPSLRESLLPVGTENPTSQQDDGPQLLEPAFEDVTSRLTKRDQYQARNTTVARQPPKTPPEESPSRLVKLSRLGIFARYGRSPSLDRQKTLQRPPRKGPVAGTGHEGYGKYSRRGRKMSNDSGTAKSESERSQSDDRRTPLLKSSRKNSFGSSLQNSASQSAVDEFVVPRLQPVIIRGGSQTSLITSSDVEAIGEVVSAETSTIVRRISPALDPSEWLADKTTVSATTTTPSGIDDVLVDVHMIPESRIPPLALRRSQKFGPGIERSRMPAPIHTSTSIPSQLISSHDVSYQSSLESPAVSSSSFNDSNWPTTTKQQDDKLRRAWWNPFKRRHGFSEDHFVFSTDVSDSADVAFSVSAGPAPRTVPYYAMMESEGEQSSTDVVGKYLTEAIDSVPPTPGFDASSFQTKQDNVSEEQKFLSQANDSAAATHPVTNVGKSSLTDSSSTIPLKQPRLAQVGRIPKVVTRSERQHVPNRQSFSQPFSKSPAYNPSFPENWGVIDTSTAKPVLEIRTDILPSRTLNEVETASAKATSAPARVFAGIHDPEYEFPFGLSRQSSRKDSEFSVSATSEGPLPIIGPPLLPINNPQQTMRIPALGISLHENSDDEVWDEYDDFIDHVMSPTQSRRKAQDIQLEPRNDLEAMSSPLASNTIARRHRPDLRIESSLPQEMDHDSPVPKSLALPIMYPSPSLLSDKPISEDFRLRRSRIVSALHSSMDPSSPFSLREFLNEYGEPYRDSIILSEHLQNPGPSNNITAVTLPHRTVLSESSRPSSDNNHQQCATLLETVERSKDPVAQSELHYASLEVSRWLSFGRLLFSPAHEEVHTLPERNVLVIDGLGNEDWSIYCAVTYELQKAIVYDLKETNNPKQLPKTFGPSNMPINHRRTELKSLSERFPFTGSFFSAIVLRFPPAMAEKKLKNIISECRRILVPGGHLEVMLLDLDIVNMGIQTRRAVRELKIKMATKNSEISLKPLIDNFQFLLGGKGFSSLNRCVVGVPVTGRPTSYDSSSSSRSSRASEGVQAHLSVETAQNNHPLDDISTQSHLQPNYSLNDLVTDHSESADARIGRVVSKTARSWWQHCYEASIIPNGDLSRSVFANKKVLEECKARASSFKLLIAYAQRPVFETKGRT